MKFIEIPEKKFWKIMVFDREVGYVRKSNRDINKYMFDFSCLAPSLYVEELDQLTNFMKDLETEKEK